MAVIKGQSWRRPLTPDSSGTTRRTSTTRRSPSCFTSKQRRMHGILALCRASAARTASDESRHPATGGPMSRFRTAVTVVTICLLASGCNSVEGTGQLRMRRTPVDASRCGSTRPACPRSNAFQKAFPHIPVEVNTINGNVGSTESPAEVRSVQPGRQGWPDAIFFPSNDDIAWATSSKINYARDLSVDLADIISGYPGGVIEQCKIGGQYRCLRNDAAPDVFWYDKVLLDAVGVRAARHLGGIRKPQPAHRHRSIRAYITGFLGDAYAPDRYLWASRMPHQRHLKREARPHQSRRPQVFTGARPTRPAAVRRRPVLDRDLLTRTRPRSASAS